MLHATYVSGKSNRYKAYMGYRDDQSPRVHEEDEITSTVLGPLDFLAPAEVHEFWRTVFSIAGLDGLLPATPPVQAKATFWDSRRARQGGLRVEPDGRVDLFWGEGEPAQQRILLIEVKWRAPLSGEDQLHRQWCDYLTDSERPLTTHVFLGIETSAGVAARHSARGDVWQGRLVLISWLQIRAAFSELMHRDDGLGRWALLGDRFLERVGIRRFLGFQSLCATEHEVKPLPEKIIFWHRFSSWGWIKKLDVLSIRALGWSFKIN